jgi:hypothetical protein
MKKTLSYLAATGTGFALSASNAFAAAQVYTGITTDITAEIAAAMPVVLSIGGILLGIGVAFRLIRRAGKF